ncbi:hypothetical protein NDN08_007995 [Rhodosorus marinus]|uniref:Pyruvate phosphate dikinase AMP/ATP-binding domain-containing protein n=1 Tax=Rhodosorus marinus TaxID=101924 RepID=A0AAV8V2Q9_9RHOD|nr:hypothetical protein NDN08_007995 [Rhodosorus marinus]
MGAEDDESYVHSGPLSFCQTLRNEDGMIHVTLSIVSDPVQHEAEHYVMHWGMTRGDQTTYIKPIPEMLPEGTPYREGKESVRTPFEDGTVFIDVDEKKAPSGIVFLIYIEASTGTREQWFKAERGGNFYFDLQSAFSEAEKKRRAKERFEAEQKAKQEKEAREKKLAEERRIKEEKLQKEKEEREKRKKLCEEYMDKELKRFSVKERKTYSFGDFGDIVYCSYGPANAPESDDPPPANVLLVTNIKIAGDPLILHWGIKVGRKGSWAEPPKECWPPQTTPKGDKRAVQTEFSDATDYVRALKLESLPNDCNGLMFVLYMPVDSKWLNRPGGGDMFISLKQTAALPGLDKKISEAAKRLAEDIVEKEMEYGSWTLMHRYNTGSYFAREVIGADEAAWALMYVWMRYSQLRVLDWQRNFNTKPRELSSAQMNFVTTMAAKYKELPKLRWIIRLVMSCVGRGGSGDLGQRIRDDILVILRHNRGWGHGSMMEQWHQKLHNNTNPDDVVICDALLAFWHSNGNIHEYWRVLGENSVTRERMAGYEQPITSEPDFPGHLKGTMIHELNQYGAILRAVHLGTDLNTILGKVHHCLSQEAKDKVNHYMHIRNENRPLIDMIRASAHARRDLHKHLENPYIPDDERRDAIFLDLALESDTRRVVEGGDLDGSLWAHLSAIRAAATGLAMSEGDLPSAAVLHNVENEMRQAIERIGFYGESEDVGLRAAAALNHARTCLTTVVDRYKTCFGNPAEALGRAFQADRHVVKIFVEEAVRGGPAYSLSTLIRKASPGVRRIARMGPYQVISPYDKETTGRVYCYEHLRESMGQTIEKGAVIIADFCDGDEDVPDGTRYVIIGSTVDVLSHVAVRARNEHHGLIACLDADELTELKTNEACLVKAKLEGETFKIEVLQESLKKSQSMSMNDLKMGMKRVKSKGLITPPSGLHAPPSGLTESTDTPGEAALLRKTSSQSLLSVSGVARKASVLPERLASAAWAIRPSEYDTEVVGSKSLNLQKLLALGLPDWIQVPKSITIPNGAMKKAFRAPENVKVYKEYVELRRLLAKAKANDVSLCPQLRQCVMRLSTPGGLADSLRGILDELGCEEIDESMPAAWEAVKGVWASIWNERAHLARRKLMLEVEDVDMAVLCQKVVDADYAFVIHTTNPVNSNEDEIYGEVVVGLGETLVSNSPGQALSFVTSKKNPGNPPMIKAYPSKSYALKGGAFIFRSDSNAEDLEGFAGAGLHDSISLQSPKKIDVDYSKDKIMNDDKFREELMGKVGAIGKAVEDTMGGFPQDIEGCFREGQYYIVQARPQV